MNFLKYTIIIVFAGIMTTSCNDFLAINTNPNVPQEAPAHALLPPMFQNAARALHFDSRFIGKYNQWYFQNTAANTWDLHGYDAGSDNCGEVWRQHYWAIGKNVDLMITDATARNIPQYIAIGYALRAWGWQAIADVYGDAILKQAWDATRNTFDYDSQEEIYKEVDRLCDLALTQVDLKGTADPNLAAADQFYGGDMTKWKRFINGIKARNAHRLTNKASYDADKVIALCDASLSSNSDNATVPFLGSVADDANFMGTLRNNHSNFRQSAYIVSLLDGTNPVMMGARDPRLRLMLAPSATDTIVRGATNNVTTAANIPNLWGTYTVYTAAGTPATAAVSANAGVKGRYLFHDLARHPIMIYSEIQLIKAEAAFRKGDKTTALVAYKNAIGAHVDFTLPYANLGSSNLIIPISAAQKTALLADTRIVPTVADSLTMDRIMAQKYIALWGWGLIETWNDLRRFHYGADMYKGQPVFSGFKLPTIFATANLGKPAYRVRPRYNSEYIWNLDALKKIGGDLGSFHTTELWFTKP
jgi:Starch-binding associating with outer membrane